MPELRGRLAANAPLADITWFRVGGPAQVLFTPADEADLAYFLKNKPAGPAGLRHRPRLEPARARRRRAGRRHSARARLRRDHDRGRTPSAGGHRRARRQGRARRGRRRASPGLAFYRGIPGSIGGALRMNAGAHGRETKDVLVAARAVDPEGNIHVLSLADMKFTYRHCGIPDDWIFTEALFQGAPGDPGGDRRRRWTRSPTTASRTSRSRSAPAARRSRTRRATAPGSSIDEAGCRGLRVGGAKVSEMHCNFLINDQERVRRGRRAPRRDGARARQARSPASRSSGRSSGSGCRARGGPMGEALAETVPHEPTRHRRRRARSTMSPC